MSRVRASPILGSCGRGFFDTHALYLLFFFIDAATTEIYTLSLHDALPISQPGAPLHCADGDSRPPGLRQDRQSTRLNSSHRCISYAVSCLKKKSAIAFPLPAWTKADTRRCIAERSAELRLSVAQLCKIAAS